jgi:hypothetical protein
MLKRRLTLIFKVDISRTELPPKGPSPKKRWPSQVLMMCE